MENNETSYSWLGKFTTVKQECPTSVMNPLNI